MISNRLPAEYVLALRWSNTTGTSELTSYLKDLSSWLDVTVVDGSPPEVYADHHARWEKVVRHLPPEPWPGGNGKVAGVVTGVRAARHEFVIIADDDVRWDRPIITAALALLDTADLVRPQNFFRPLPWHARWDTARTLINRALGADYPGTYLVRRSTFLQVGGYDGNVLFENLELSRTIKAAGGREVNAKSIFVPRLAPAARHFWRQRIRQAYDDLGQPLRLITEAAMLPLTLGWLAGCVRSSDPRRCARGLVAPATLLIGVAEVGRRRANGRSVFPSGAALWAPVWAAERAVCVWLALGYRLTGGMPYAATRLRTAAHSVRRLRRSAGRSPLSPLTGADRRS